MENAHPTANSPPVSLWQNETWDQQHRLAARLWVTFPGWFRTPLHEDVGPAEATISPDSQGWEAERTERLRLSPRSSRAVPTRLPLPLSFQVSVFHLLAVRGGGILFCF